MKKLITLFSLMLCILATAQENVDGEYMYIFRSDKSVERIPIAEIDSVTFADSNQMLDLGLPRVYVVTPEGAGITSKTEWLENCSIRIVNENGVEDLNTSTSVRGRGNSTWTYPKKPYAIKLDSKSEVLGMPKHKRWVLLANWLDRTLLRNDVALEMGRRIMEWAPRGRFVELYLNGEHQGNYYLCEQIKVDKNRVYIDELDEKTDFADESQITGGYLLEYDKYGPNDEINYFYSQVQNYPVTIKEPDEEVITSWEHPAYLYIQGYVNELEKMLEADKDALVCWSEIERLIDVTSYIDWWLINELVCNGEIIHPKSSYMYKKRGGKLYAGPVWDFDYGTFRRGGKSLILLSSLYYKYFFAYPEFRLAVKERWAGVKDVLADVDGYILEQAGLIKASNELNISIWPITQTVNYDEKMTFDEAVESMRQVFLYRMELVDDYILSLE